MPALRPDQIVYVSCSPPTMARDLKLLIEGGFLLNKLALFDMFPRTSHVEAVASLFANRINTS